MNKPAETKPADFLHGITIWLDNYDDIFSDFDSRDYESRALSDDFIGELRKIVREDENKQDLREFHLLIPSKVRNKKTEEIITHRLTSYFRKNHQRLMEDARKTRLKGILCLSAGVLFLLVAGYVSFLQPAAIGLHLLMITLEPAGWFFIWMGYDQLHDVIIRKKSDVDFLTRMIRNRIVFKEL